MQKEQHLCFDAIRMDTLVGGESRKLPETGENSYPIQKSEQHENSRATRLADHDQICAHE
jgi:hypothetical protein